MDGKTMPWVLSAVAAMVVAAHLHAGRNESADLTGGDGVAINQKKTLSGQERRNFGGNAAENEAVASPIDARKNLPPLDGEAPSFPVHQDESEPMVIRLGASNDEKTRRQGLAEKVHRLLDGDMPVAAIEACIATDAALAHVEGCVMVVENDRNNAFRARHRAFESAVEGKKSKGQVEEYDSTPARAADGSEHLQCPKGCDAPDAIGQMVTARRAERKLRIIRVNPGEYQHLDDALEAERACIENSRKLLHALVMDASSL